MARDTTPDKIQLQVVIDGSPARKELAELRQATAKLRDEQKGLIEQQRQLSDQRKAASAKGDVAEVQRIIQAEKALRAERDLQITSMKELQAKQMELRASMDPLEMSLTELRQKARELKSAWDAGLGSPEELAKIGKELQLVEQRIQALGTQQGRALMLWEQDRKQIDLNRMSLEQLALEEKRWQAIKNSREGNSAEYREAEEGLRQVKERQDELTNAKRRGMEAWEEERKAIALTDMTLEQLEKEYERAKQIRDQAKPGLEYDKAAADLNNITQQQEKLTNAKLRSAEAWEEERKAIALTDMTLEQLEMEYKRAEAIRAQAKPGGEYDKANADLLAVKDRLEQMTNANRQAAEQWEKTRQSMRLEDMTIEQLKQEKQHLEQLRAALPRTGAEYDKLGKDIREVDAALADVKSGLSQQERDWNAMRQTLRLTDMTMEQLEMEAKRLNNVLRTTDPNTAQWALYRRELTAVEARTKTLTSGLGPFGRMWAEIRGNVLSAGAVLGGMFAGQAMFSGIGNMIRSSAELSDAISAVRKTTGLSTPVVRELASELSKIDTRTSRAELLALARDAGKLGISAKDDVLAFVKAGNQINVALGEDLGEGAIKSIGKLVEMFKLKEQFGLERSMLKVGSAINELGMASTAAEGFMVDFMNRMGGIATQSGVTIDQTLALGATLDSLGQTSEVSSTAITQMFVKMAKDSETYSRLAGIPVLEFEQLMKKNALEAFIAVLEGSKNTEGGLMALAETFQELGVDGTRAIGIFGALSNNTELLREQMALAKVAYEDGTSITAEYQEVNNNLAATLAKLGKEFNRLVANNTLIDFFSRLAVVAREAIDWMERNSNTLVFLGKVLLNTAVAWGSYKVATALAGKASIIAATVTNALATAKGVLTGKISMATAAMRGFNAVSKLNVFGLLISGLTTLVSLWSSFSDSMKEAAGQLGQEVSQLRLLHAEIMVTNADAEKRKKLIDELKSTYPKYLENLDSETISNEELGKAIAFVNEQLINKAIIQRKDAELEAQTTKAMEAKMELMDQEKAIRKDLEAMSLKTGIDLRPAESLMEQLRNFRKEAEAKGKLGFWDTQAIGGAQVALKALEMTYGNEQAKNNKLLEERKELVKEVGMAGQYMTEAEKAAAAATAAATTKKEQQLHIIQQINDEIQSLEAERIGNTDTGVRRRIDMRLMELKLERNAAKEAMAATEAEVAGLEEKRRTIGLIDEEISNLQKTRSETWTTEQNQALDAKIKALEKERDAILGVKNTAATNKAVENLDAVEDAYRATIERMSLDQQDADAKELLALDLKHAEEIKKVREQQALLVKAKRLSPEQAETELQGVGDNQVKAREDLIKAQNQKRWDAMREANERISDLLGDARRTELDNELEYLDAEIAMRMARGESVLELERERSRVQLMIYQQNADDALLLEAEKWDETISQAREAMLQYEEAMAANGLDPTEEELATLASHHEKVLELERAQAIAIEQIKKRLRQQERQEQWAASQKEREYYAYRIQTIVEWANAVSGAIQGVIANREVDIQLAEQRADADGARTQEEIDNIERLKQKRRNAALVHIAVQAAAAVASAVASALASTIPFPGNLLAAAPAVGTVLGLIAQARALINGSDESSVSSVGQNGANGGGASAIPEGAKGGVLQGPSHANGGLGVYDPEGRQVAELEGGEAYAVLSKPFVQKNADLLPSLFQASREGTRFKPFDRDLVMPNPKSVQRAMQVVHMAGGGVLGSGSSYKYIKGGGGLVDDGDSRARNARGTALVNMPTGPDEGQDRTEELLRAMLRAMENYPTQLTAKVGIIDTERRKTEYDQIRKLASGRVA